MQGPIEAIVGLLFGIFWGLLVIYIPGRDSTERNLGRLFLLLGGALLAMFGSSAQGVELPGSGALVLYKLYTLKLFMFEYSQTQY